MGEPLGGNYERSESEEIPWTSETARRAPKGSPATVENAGRECRSGGCGPKRPHVIVRTRNNCVRHLRRTASWTRAGRRAVLSATEGLASQRCAPIIARQERFRRQMASSFPSSALRSTGPAAGVAHTGLRPDRGGAVAAASFEGRPGQFSETSHREPPSVRSKIHRSARHRPRRRRHVHDVIRSSADWPQPRPRYRHLLFDKTSGRSA